MGISGETYHAVGAGRVGYPQPVWTVVGEPVLASVLVKSAAAAHDEST